MTEKNMWEIAVRAYMDIIMKYPDVARRTSLEPIYVNGILDNAVIKPKDNVMKLFDSTSLKTITSKLEELHIAYEIRVYFDYPGIYLL